MTTDCNREGRLLKMFDRITLMQISPFHASRGSQEGRPSAAEQVTDAEAPPPATNNPPRLGSQDPHSLCSGKSSVRRRHKAVESPTMSSSSSSWMCVWTSPIVFVPPVPSQVSPSGITHRELNRCFIICTHNWPEKGEKGGI